MKPSRRIVVRGRALTIPLFVIAFLALFLMGQTLLCGLATDASWCGWWPHFSLDRIQNLVRSAGAWAVAVSIALMVLHSFVPFPAEFITVTNGLVFGFTKGVVVTWVGAMLGAMLAFALARSLGRPYVLRRLSKEREAQLEKWVDRIGTDTLLIGRFIPAISFNLMNYGAGLAPVTWWTFLWTTAIGILPVTILMVWAGGRLDEIPLWAWALLALTALFMVVIFHVLKALKEVTHKETIGGNEDEG
jgi:uncharacterized membrane protein YdjX (TVP38/TMEM64 family)